MEKTDFETAASSLRAKLVDMARFYLSDLPEAEDVAQETMLKLWILRDRIDPKQGLFPLAAAIARNLCIDRLRRFKARPQEPLAGHDMPGRMQDAQTRMEEAENAAWMHDALRRIPDRYRAVLRMRQVEGLDTSEIARLIGTSENAVRILLSRARQQMMELLNQRKE